MWIEIVVVFNLLIELWLYMKWVCIFVNMLNDFVYVVCGVMIVCEGRSVGVFWYVMCGGWGCCGYYYCYVGMGGKWDY